MKPAVHTLASYNTRRTDCGKDYDEVRHDYVITRAMARLVTCEGCRAGLLAAQAQEAAPCDA
jgi:hypothetical protein